MQNFINAALHLYAGIQIKEEDIITALEELKRWEARRKAALEELESSHADNKEFAKEKVAKITKQIDYYSKLVADMKNELCPARMSDFVNTVSGR